MPSPARFMPSLDWFDFEEAALKKAMATRYCKGAESSSFYSLLPASKQRRVDAYKKLDKVQGWMSEGKEVAAWLNFN